MPSIDALGSRVQGNASTTTANTGPVTTDMIKEIGLQRMTVPDTTQPTATTGESFPAGDLWKDQPAIVFVVRRPGCPLCREHGESRFYGGRLVTLCGWGCRKPSLYAHEAMHHDLIINALIARAVVSVDQVRKKM